MFSNYSIAFALVGTASCITREPLLTWKPTNKKTHPMDYPVPSYGEDRDMITTRNNLYESEAALNHKWKVTAADLKKEEFKDYRVPNFGVDQDIDRTHQNLREAEATVGHAWIIKDKKDQPKPHPVDYFVPNFGADSDIDISRANLADAEKTVGHKWVVTKE